jgi:hypothetical protein
MTALIRIRTCRAAGRGSPPAATTMRWRACLRDHPPTTACSWRDRLSAIWDRRRSATGWVAVLGGTQRPRHAIVRSRSRMDIDVLGAHRLQPASGRVLECGMTEGTNRCIAATAGEFRLSYAARRGRTTRASGSRNGASRLAGPRSLRDIGASAARVGRAASPRCSSADRAPTTVPRRDATLTS